jgi:hypothetical protein
MQLADPGVSTGDIEEDRIKVDNVDTPRYFGGCAVSARFRRALRAVPGSATRATVTTPGR